MSILRDAIFRDVAEQDRPVDRIGLERDGLDITGRVRRGLEREISQ
jgi:hypothetical protein